MAEIKITEGEFRVPDGTLLYQKTWAPYSTPVAKLVLFHGFSDHIDNYHDFFMRLAPRGILCTGIDQRGWGRSVHSKADRGNTGPTTLILADYASFIEAQLTAYPSQLVFVMGHSMGGGLVATLASTQRYKQLMSTLGGIMLYAPYIALVPDQEPRHATVFLGRLLGKLLPRYQLTQEIKVETLVRDPAVQHSIKNDPLNHDTGTLEMFVDMLDRAAQLSSGRLALKDGIKSVYVAHGTGDKCTSYDASKRWFDAQTGHVLDKRYRTYSEWGHILHLDLPESRQVFADDCAAWILERSNA
ncbi:acylglycerol lipase [Aspergillus lucknowensis]|uniref:Alpha/Beta hydrolase protein n=1 Tax=Aspergillus lucknowensis TaxID=176173 RepID=A0ABR4LWW0_9EURO